MVGDHFHRKPKIGDHFRIEGNPAKLWQITDVGSRVIIAIPINASDASWANGPPYAVAEVVFDEDDIPSIIFDADNS